MCWLPCRYIIYFLVHIADTLFLYSVYVYEDSYASMYWLLYSYTYTYYHRFSFVLFVVDKKPHRRTSEVGSKDTILKIKVEICFVWRIRARTQMGIFGAADTNTCTHIEYELVVVCCTGLSHTLTAYKNSYCAHNIFINTCTAVRMHLIYTHEHKCECVHAKFIVHRI